MERGKDSIFAKLTDIKTAAQRFGGMVVSTELLPNGGRAVTTEATARQLGKVVDFKISTHGPAILMRILGAALEVNSEYRPSSN